jgi:NADPH2:quinone reductase
VKALRLEAPGGPEVLQLVDLPLPAPRPREVRVLARAIGAGGPDVLIRNGTYKWMPPLPAIPGNELAGVVDAVGREVTALCVGHRVLVSARELPQRGGCYAETICVDETAPFVLPDTIGFDDAVSLGNYQLALALMSGHGGEGAQSILLPGAAGGVAIALAQVARDRGLRVIGTASSEAKREFALEHGAQELVAGDPADLAARVRELTHGRGVDLAFDHVGGALFTACLHSLAPFGLLVSYNARSGPPDCDLFTELRKLIERSLAVRTFSIHSLDHDRQRRRALMHQAVRLMAEGRLRPPPSSVFDLADARRVHELLENGAGLGKMVLRP